LDVVDLRADGMTLDLATHLMPVLDALLAAGFEKHVQVASRAVEALLDSFGAFVQSVRLAPPLSGVDLSGEERLQRCTRAHEGLLQIAHTAERAHRAFAAKPDMPVYAAVAQVHRRLQEYLDPRPRGP
jgi:hypothetical protein